MIDRCCLVRDCVLAGAAWTIEKAELEEVFLEESEVGVVGDCDLAVDVDVAVH